MGEDAPSKTGPWRKEISGQNQQDEVAEGRRDIDTHFRIWIDIDTQRVKN
jgi:hypothetical protein